jgi:hypothetical protein
MNFVLTINLGNEAMKTSSDVARLLHDLADKIGVRGEFKKGQDASLRDLNGNLVGYWRVK